jgi:hypothetical protein
MQDYLHANGKIGRTVLGIMIAQDATHLTNVVGKLAGHPILISATNIDSKVRCNSAWNAWEMIALLPIPKWRVKDKKLQAALSARLMHICERIVFDPFIALSHTGLRCGDAFGTVRIYHPILATFSVDGPEATKLSGTMSSVSPVTFARAAQFGDPVAHKVRSSLSSRATVAAIEARLALDLQDPTNYLEFVMECRKEGLIGVDRYLCDGWFGSDIGNALAFDLLHALLKFFADHLRDWCSRAVGAAEIDFRFKLTPPRQGFLRFKNGVANLKKTGGRDHRNMMRYMVAIIDGAVPNGFMDIIRAFIAYAYLAQATEVDDAIVRLIEQLLQEFHAKKDVVHTKGFRKTPGWAIPKLELQHNISRTIMKYGNLLGLSTDTSERLHIFFLKEPFRRTNKKEFWEQIVLDIERAVRMRHFDLATKLIEELVDLSDGKVDPKALAPKLTRMVTKSKAEYTDFFAIGENLELAEMPDRERNRHRTRVASDFTALHLNRDPSRNSIFIEDAEQEYGIPSGTLRRSIQEYYYGLDHPGCYKTGRAFSGLKENIRQEELPTLPFTHIKVWHSIRIQNKSVIRRGETLKALSLKALPTTTPGWKNGKCDYCVFMDDPSKEFDGYAAMKGKSPAPCRTG